MSPENLSVSMSSDDYLECMSCGSNHRVMLIKTGIQESRVCESCWEHLLEDVEFVMSDGDPDTAPKGKCPQRGMDGGCENCGAPSEVHCWGPYQQDENGNEMPMGPE